MSHAARRRRLSRMQIPRVPVWRRFLGTLISVPSWLSVSQACGLQIKRGPGKRFRFYDHRYCNACGPWVAERPGGAVTLGPETNWRSVSPRWARCVRDETSRGPTCEVPAVL